jgi:hypothetical protein
LLWGAAVAVGLIAIIVALLGFSHAWSVRTEPRCFDAFPLSQFPKWIGCVMSAHEGLAAGLIGAAGALFAAWLAFTAVQEQFAEERRQRERSYAEAKEVAVVVLAQPVHAAACTLLAINEVLAAEAIDATRPTVAASTAAVERDKAVNLGISYLQNALNNFAVREGARDLGVEDRMLYVAICSTFATVVDLSNSPGQQISRREHLMNRQRALMHVQTYLRGFNTELANVYERDSGISPPMT